MVATRPREGAALAFQLSEDPVAAFRLQPGDVALEEAFVIHGLTLP